MNPTTVATSAIAGKARSVVITGVGRPGQFGDALSRYFARGGARVAIVARTLPESTARAAEMAAAGLDATAFACDLSDHAATAGLADDVHSRFGDVDALVNVAGGFALDGPVADADPLLLGRQFTINAATAYHATRAFLPALRHSRGAVVFVTSAAALPGARVRNIAAYAMAKSAVITLMRAIAQEERANGVRSNAVAPTAIRTASNLEAMPADTRYVEADDLAATICFLCSDTARSITGQVIELAP